VLDKAKDGSWGKIVVWNSPVLTALEMKVNRSWAYTGNIVMYQLKVRNTSPAPQPFKVEFPIPENTTYLRGMVRRDTNTVTWEGTVQPYGVAVSHVWVRTPARSRTEIVGTARSRMTGGRQRSVMTK
jgi:uncharacterized repeat protein (TIGR01451 family)